MIILGLDASTTAVGWCLLQDGEYANSGVFKPQGDDWKERVAQIDYFLSNLMLEHCYNQVHVGYEVASGAHGNMHTNRLLGAVHWACWSATEWDWATWHEINVQQVKQAAANKTEDGMMGARAISGKEDIGEDEADAIGVALACWGKRYEMEGRS